MVTRFDSQKVNLLRSSTNFLLVYFSGLVIQIGPPNPIFLKSTDKSTWNAKDVADSVLSDKSALVIYYLPS